jgi:transcriptional regulator with XRE-family HTH domain
MTATRRQMITAAAALNGRVRPTQAELAARFGITQSAVAHRLRRFRKSLSAEQRERYARCLGRRGHRVRMKAIQLSLVENL